jgi:protein TonB
MNEVMRMDQEFDVLLQSALLERKSWAEPLAGIEQRLNARLAQQERDTPRVFSFAERVQVKRSAASTWFALGAHAVALLVVFAVVSTSRQILQPVRRSADVVALSPPPPIAPRAASIGGGGGQHDLAAVTQGHLPKLAQEQIAVPKIPPTIAPQLAVEPSVVVQKDLKMADNTMPNLGLPNSSVHGPVSIGTGNGTGIGSGDGSGIGAGSGGNTGGGVYHIGGSVHAPTVLTSVDPEFSEEARKAKFSGNVLIYLIVDEHGNPTHVRVERGIGMGLDERAVDAVRQYKFKPATQNGKPVKVDLTIDVGFQIF